jgi:hypothetical protein
MKKHRIDNIRKVSGASEPEITPEHHKKNVERVVDMIMDVVDRLPANPAPVLESYEDLLNEMRHGVKRQPTIIQNDFSKSAPLGTTQIISSASEPTQTDSGKNKFTSLELELIRQIENAK